MQFLRQSRGFRLSHSSPSFLLKRSKRTHDWRETWSEPSAKLQDIEIEVQRRIWRPWPDSKRIPISGQNWWQKENPCGEVAHFKGLRCDFSECFKPKSPEAYCWDHLGVYEESASTRANVSRKHQIGRATLPKDLARPQRGVANEGISRKIRNMQNR